MEYLNLLNILARAGFTRIERDDRLLDVFLEEIREKGIELWEYWGKDTVYLIRIHLPFRPKFIKLYQIPRSKIEQLLQQNKTRKLSSLKPHSSTAAEVINNLIHL